MTVSIIQATMEDVGPKVICVGDCARRYAKEHGLPIATGCPPKPEVVAALV